MIKIIPLAALFCLALAACQSTQTTPSAATQPALSATPGAPMSDAGTIAPDPDATFRHVGN